MSETIPQNRSEEPGHKPTIREKVSWLFAILNSANAIRFKQNAPWEPQPTRRPELVKLDEYAKTVREVSTMVSDMDLIDHELTMSAIETWSHHPEPHIRRLGGLALSRVHRLGDERTTQIYETLIADPDEAVRDTARGALKVAEFRHRQHPDS